MDDIREEKPHFTDVKYDFFTWWFQMKGGHQTDLLFLVV
jgi:hypothetical protein